MQPTGHNIIAGEASREGRDEFRATDPGTGAEIPVSYADATPGEVDCAVTAAAAAFRETDGFPPERMAGFLETLAKKIESLGHGLLELTDSETALGLPRLEMERARTCNQLRAFAALLSEGSYVEAIIDTPDPRRKPVPKPDIRRMRVPIGPVAVFGASNFPLAFGICGGDSASAWAAGCPVVAKGHPLHPGTSELLARAVESATEKSGLPLGWFSLLQGKGFDVGRELVMHPGIEAVAFTGSLKGGRAVHDMAAARPVPVPVYAEMGSLNPVFIMSGAIEKRGAELSQELAGSVTQGVGQYCTKPGLVFLLDGSASQEFMEQVAEAMEAKPCAAMLSHAMAENLAAMAERSAGIPAVKVVTGGGPAGSGMFRNTVMSTDADTFMLHRELAEEHFGPVTLFVTCRNMDQMVAVVEHLGGQLAGVFHAEPGDWPGMGKLYMALRRKVGRLVWNGAPTGVEVCHAMQHGGPYPATTSSTTTSVGMTAIKRFLRPVAYQNFPDANLPEALKAANPLGIMRLVNGRYKRL